MNENEMMTMAATGELIDSPASGNPLENLTTVSFEEFRRDAFRGTMSELAKWAHEDGNSEAVLHAGEQLTTEQVINHVLTIMATQYAYIPDEKEENGVKRYPVVVFAEAPSYWYNMGELGGNLIRDWAKRAGDDPEENPYLPNLNQMLTDCGGVRIHFRMKHSSKNNRDYVSITIA